MGIVASVAVGLVLLVAGAAKIASRERWPAEAGALGAPMWVVPVVPWIEIALGAAMTASLRRDVTAWLAVALFAIFTGLIVANLMRGRRPVCACFGALSARPLGWSHVARNAILIVLAVVAGVA